MINLEKYIDLILKVGINIKENQTLVISTPIECKEFIRLVVLRAYEYGAKDVIVYWKDDIIDKIRYEMASDDILDDYPQWVVDLFDKTAEKDAAYLRVFMSDPELLKNLDSSKISRYNKAKNIALKDYNERIMTLKNSWCTIAVPTENWANKVFSGKKNAMNLLWDSIYKAVRADKVNPVDEWKKHQDMIKKKIDFLNFEKFKYLKYSNSLGTDLIVELPRGHYWGGAMSKTPLGQEFIANIPTEEVFTLPKLDGINGRVYSSMPLNYNGCLIDKFNFTFKDGLIVDYSAKQGYEVLKELLESDEGAKRIGEIALVSYDSPISKQNILFYNTLLDENASCHLALGKAYPMIEGAEKMDGESKRKSGINDSLIHVDFMIGTEDLNIIGVKENGEEIQIFEKGNWFARR